MRIRSIQARERIRIICLNLEFIYLYFLVVELGLVKTVWRLYNRLRKLFFYLSNIKHKPQEVSAEQEPDYIIDKELKIIYLNFIKNFIIYFK